MAAEGRFSPDHDKSQLERLSFFSDAVFAIAMTLLVVEVRLPPLHAGSEAALGQALLDLIPHYVGFVVSFLVIGRFWIGHHGLFGLLDGTNSRLLWTNLFFLLAIAFMPFPTAVISEHAQLRVGVCFYAAWLVLLGLLNMAVSHAAFARGELLKPGVDPSAKRRRFRSSLVPVLLGLLAMAAAAINPLWAIPALVIGGPVLGAVVRRAPKRATLG